MRKLEDLKKMDNIADILDEKELEEIGHKALTGFRIDKESRQEWESSMEEALEIVKQIYEVKARGALSVAANIKYPLLCKGCIDFAARTYPEIVKNDRVVYTKVLGSDENGDKLKRAVRVMDFMNYQFLSKIEDWEDGVDSLLIMLPVFGTCFKKVYYDPVCMTAASEVIPPSHIVINRREKSLKKAQRISHILVLSRNDIIERQRMGLFREDAEGEVQASYESVVLDRLRPDLDSNNSDYFDETRPVELIEQHCWLDLDGDGYNEPYIVTLHATSGFVYRIKERFGEIKKNKGQLIRIAPKMYFVDYHFIKNPDGSFYSLGLGSLLFPINKSINSLINQLIDAGTLANLPCGLITSQVRLKQGAIKFEAGEYKVVESGLGASLRDQIFPLPVKEASPTLFNLLELLIGVAKDMASINDVMQGKQAVTNVPATTMMTLIDQGMKVINSITKRVLRGFTKEYKLMFDINKEHLTDDEYSTVLDEPFIVASVDFDSSNCDIYPVADPEMSSNAQRLTKARAILDLFGMMPGILRPELTAVHYLTAMDLKPSEIAQLIVVPDPNAPPPPDAQEQLAHAQLMLAQAKATEAGIMMDGQSLEMNSRSKMAAEAEALARIDKMRHDALISQLKQQNVETKLHQDNVSKTASALNADAQLSLEQDKMYTELQKEMIKSGTQVNVAKLKQTEPGRTDK